MALTNRNNRQASSRRLVNVALALTIIVLLVYVAVESKSTKVDQSVSSREWVQQVDPLVAQSNAQGQAFNAFRTASPQSTTAAKLTASLDSLRSGADGVYQKISTVKAPPALSLPAGLLRACLQTRAKAATSAVEAIESELSTNGSASAGSATATVLAAVQQLQVADQAYSLFVQDLPASLGWKPAASAWIGSTALYQQASLETFLGSLGSQFSTAPTYRAAIVAITTEPSPIKTLGKIEVIPDAQDLAPSVVVGNLGNTSLSHVTVTVGISQVTPKGTGHAFATLSSLSPGAYQTVDFPALNPPTGVVFNLTVSITLPSGSQAPSVQKTIQFEMPSAGGTSTTSSPSSSTTAPNKKS